MSILWCQPPAAVAEVLRVNALLVVLSAVCLGLAAGTRALTLRRLPGPARIPPDQSAWPLAGILFGAMGFWLLAISAAAQIWAALAPKYGASTQPTESDAGTAIINTVPSVVGLIALLAGDHVIFPSVRQDLGLSGKRLGRGVLWGVGGALLVIPPLFLASQLMEWVYRSVHYQHPTEHPLLHVLGEGPSRWVGILIIVGACLIAPVFEELIFRGHLQTLILRAIQAVAIVVHRLFAPGDPAPRVEGASELSGGEAGASSAAPPVLQHQPGATSREKVQRSNVPAILSILITSLLFAAVHPAWSFPIIFLLALALGYAYERTGNLWVPIAMHSMFNTISTFLFLAGMGS
jgi:membrane protease YdiL (CAAX protease family)